MHMYNQQLGGLPARMAGVCPACHGKGHGGATANPNHCGPCNGTGALARPLAVALANCMACGAPATHWHRAGEEMPAGHMACCGCQGCGY